MPIGNMGGLQFLHHNGAEMRNNLRLDQLPVTFRSFASQAMRPVHPSQQVIAAVALFGSVMVPAAAAATNLASRSAPRAWCREKNGINFALAGDGIATGIEFQFE
jgi:hypothetical protein